ncbi:MAG: N-acetyltransferase [Streptomycetaceae bacterium]|jgi:RimJ/RimL family protein N-acetyltransferase|nr:N-acetyltransferase [Streptomycetaceae bacterium]
MTVRFPAPVFIQGRYIRLVPLDPLQVPDLFEAGGDDDGVWSWLPTITPRSQAELSAVVEQRLAQQAAGEAVMFTVVPHTTNRPAGWAAYTDISIADERLDIGYQWLGRFLWGTPAHLETHFMLMYNAFENLNFGRVQWQLDHLDQLSQEIVTRIGGIPEGVLRRHLRRTDGSWRDTVFYSLLASEWPAARDRWMAGLILDWR